MARPRREGSPVLTDMLDGLRALPGPLRQRLRRAVCWAAAAACLDGLCGLLLVPLIGAWFAGEAAEAARWTGLLAAATLCQAWVGYAALRRGYLAGGMLASGLAGQLLRRLPRVASPRALRAMDAPGLLRGPVLQAMALPAHLLAPLAGAVVTPLTVIAGLAAIHPGLAGYAAGTAGLLAALLRCAGRRTQSAERALRRADQALARQLRAYAEHQPLLRLAGRAGQAGAALERAIETQRRRAQRLMRRSLPAGLACSAAAQAAFAGLLAGGALAVRAQWLDPATLVAALVLMLRFLEPLSQLTYLDQSLRGAWQALAAVLRALHAPAIPSPGSGERPRDAGVEAEDLEYALPCGAVPVAGIGVECPPGRLVAIVGPSGAGKSTLLALLRRIVDPTRGRVRLGGADARCLDEATLAAHCDLLFQDCRLWRGSLAFNLRAGRPGAEPEALWRALEAVGMAGEVRAMPQGLESEVGEGGGLLSGGQRQRIGVARGLLSEARVLLMDEPTAQLDARAAARVRASLAAERGRRTVIVATHSPALARIADEIWVLERGRMRARGRHEALRAADAWYARFAGSGDR